MKKRGLISIIIIAVLLLSSTILLFKYSHSIAYSSDNVSGILEAHSFINGNYLLHSFAISTDNFYLTDLPFYIIYETFAGINTFEISFVPILIYVLVIILSSLLVSLNFKNMKDKIKGIITTLVLLGFPSFFLLNTTLTGQIHVGTVLFILASFIFFKLFLSKKNYWYLIPLFISEFIYLLSDPFAIWIGAIPIIIAAIIAILQNRNYLEKGIVAIVITIINLLLSKISISVIKALGGFHIVAPVPYKFSHLSKIPGRMYLAINSILYYFGSHFFGKKLFLLSTMEELIKTLFIVLFIYLVYKIIKSRKISIINTLLLSAIFLNLSAFIFSNIVHNMSFARYMMPLTVFSLVFIALNIVYLLKKKWVIYISFLFALFLIFSFIYRVGHFPVSSHIRNEKKLVSFLESKNLKYGIGTYWDSSITTVLSSNKVNVRAVLITQNSIYPLIWLSSTKWYHPTSNKKFQFFVFGGNKYDKVSHDFTLATFVFGKSYKKYHIADYTVLVWKHNINSTLSIL
ncbi:hypothetical protein M1145_02995 [Patescibacteria group bacterium]|nr:hypothetical protein [Patescibacteria group bacterium]